MDEIIIENLKVFAHHGVYQEETKKGQNFYVPFHPTYSPLVVEFGTSL